MIGTSQAADWVTASDGSVQLALSTKLTAELVREGLARDFVRQIQQMRKDANLEIEDRITITYAANGEAAQAIEAFADYIQSETLADELRAGLSEKASFVRVGEQEVQVRIERV
jgi:isoleucyl-tRNA synthetase